MSNEVETLKPVYAVYNIKTFKYALGGRTFATAGAAKLSWNAHTRKWHIYPEWSGYYGKQAVWKEDAHDYVVVKLNLVVAEDET